MRTILLLIIGLNIMAVAAASDWEEHDVTLKWGESVSFYNYNITAVDFRPGTVEERPELCEKYETDSVQRNIFGCDDYVFLRIFKNGDRVWEAALTKENHTYIDHIEFFNETTYEDTEFSLRILAQDIITGRNIPSPYAQLNIFIKSNESYFDIADNLTIEKNVPDYAYVNQNSSSIPVTITVKNIGAYNLTHILVNDSVPDDFISETKAPVWGISLKSGEIWQKEYFIKPVKPIGGNEYTLPPAHLYFSRYNLSTESVSFILHSSEIIVTKTADKTNVSEPGNVTVDISVKNNGSEAALVKVQDSIIPDMEIMGGELNFSIVLQPGEYYNQSYMLKLNNISDNISLPSASYEFKEYFSKYDAEKKFQINSGSGISNPVEITFASAVSSPVQTTPPPAPTVEKPSIEPTPANNQGINGALTIIGYKVPYTYLAILAGGLLISIIFYVLKVWRLLGLSK